MYFDCKQQKLPLAKFAKKRNTLEGHQGLAQRIIGDLNKEALEVQVPGSSKELYIGIYDVPL